MTLKEAYDLALKQGPTNETRKAACQDPWWAFLYARDVDQGPHDGTRAAACQNPEEAFYYALYIDKLLHPATLQAIPSIRLALLREQFEFD